MKDKKNLVLFALIAVVGLFLGGMLAFQQMEKDKANVMANKYAEVFARDYSPRMGAKEPKVVLVEFLDPECESCRRFAPIVKDLVRKHEDKVQLVVRYATFHRNSEFAVKILEASRVQGKYWETLEVLFRHQPKWGDHHNPNPQLIWTVLPEAGVDAAKIQEDMEDPQILERIKQDMEDGRTLGVRGTPTFFVNGQPLDSFGPDQLTKAVEAAL